MPDHELTAFTSGTHNLLSDEIIPADAASDSNNWYTQDGRLKLIGGRLPIGAEGAVGAIFGEIFGYRVDGTKIHWRKNSTTIQYYNTAAFIVTDINSADWDGSGVPINANGTYPITAFTPIFSTYMGMYIVGNTDTIPTIILGVLVRMAAYSHGLSSQDQIKLGLGAIRTPAFSFEDTWVDVITGLTANADYTFCNYSSLSGSFTYAVGVDGIFKMHNANPGSYLAMYDPKRNFKGYAFIDRGRMILWNRPEDKTGLYGSRVDPQGSNYTSETSQTLASGDGSTKTFTGTLVGGGSPFNGINFFGFSPFGQISAAKTITNIQKSTSTQITAAGHGFSNGDKVYISTVVGMTQINQQIGTVSIVDVDNFLVGIDSTSFTSYSSGGTVYTIEQFTDNYLGALTGNLGGAGTINYVTGTWSLTFNTAPANTSSNILANYQEENSNTNGVTDFTHSGTRLAGEGFVFPQDEGGDAIIRVLIGQDGNYYSLKSQSAYSLALDTTDLAADNLVYRRNMGMPFLRAGVSMEKGIVFMNTSNPEKPELTILQRNPVGGDIEPLTLFPQFKFANYSYDDANIDTYERYIVIFCKSLNASANDTVLLCDLAQNTVDITSFNARTSASDSSNLYIGSSITQTVYQLFTGFDDDGLALENFWTSKAENLRPNTKKIFPHGLKKLRKLRLKGRIDPDQSYAVYANYDNAGFQLVGTVLGNGTYVDDSQPEAVGVNMVGAAQVGEDITATVFPYLLELKIKAPKFRTRKFKFVALGIGYVDIESTVDHDITVFEDRIPKRFRSKQNVSLDGKTTDQASPSY